MGLTKKQQEVYDFIRVAAEERGYPPTVREIGEMLGGKSPSTVHFHLKKLQEAGLIEVAKGKTRAITLTDGGAKRGQVPVLGTVAAGTPIWADESLEGYVPFDTGNHPEDFFALRVRGNSMLGAGILPEDLVIVRRQQSARPGEIVVALFEEEATVKTLSMEQGKMWLLPENPEYEPIDGTGAQILGKVVGVTRYY